MLSDPDPELTIQRRRRALFRAVIDNDQKRVEDLLVSFREDKNTLSQALCIAAENGFASLVKLLIPISDPRFGGHTALLCAIDSGHANVVRCLLPVSDMGEIGQLALKKATTNSTCEVVGLLSEFVDVEKTATEIRKEVEEKTIHVWASAHMIQLVYKKQISAGVLTETKENRIDHLFRIEKIKKSKDDLLSHLGATTVLKPARRKM